MFFVIFGYHSTDLERVLKKEHDIQGYKLEISDKPFKDRPVPKKRKRPPETKAKEVEIYTKLFKNN